ncbi:ATP-dependent nuclease [Anoxybacillus flavithermus]|uniref:ATP-dependent nuclease n=1 Tax=Anoxybacillus flavithermus TaxID=33934 RepID=UPI00186897C3|nr:AAA family ATPase [Anoxybacillus flavithermus]MBE2914171.1 AAA family ATPase [Anoxybacillus flavithermus]
MFVSDLYIKNFRSIKDIHVSFKEGKNILIGKNNAGKSNIIKALDLLLGEKLPSKSSLDIKDFHAVEKEIQGNKKTEYANELFIAVKLSGKVPDGSDFEKIKIIRPERFGIEYWAKFENDQVVIHDKLKADFEDFDPKSDLDKFEGTNLSYWIRTKEEVVFYIYANRHGSDDEDIQFIHGMLVKDKMNEKYFRCFPISKKLRDSFITSSILPAFREPSNQLKVSNWTWYGKLLKALWDSKTKEVDEDIKKQSEMIKTLTDKVFEAATDDIKDKLKELINHSYVSFRMLPNERDDVYKNVSIYINDGIESQLSEKGSGLQSALIIGLFSYYCSRFHKCNSLLAVEEPELFLHPHARRMLSNKLDDFVSLNSDYKNQVIIATHSQEFIRNTEIENIIVVRKPEGTSETKTFSLTNNERTIQDIQKIKQLLWSKNSELFFADKVILVEGGEEYIIPVIADFIFQQPGILDKKNISVIKVGGKSQFGIYMALLRDLGIDYFVIADFDYLETGLEQIAKYIDGFDSNALSEIRAGLQKYKGDYKKSKEIKKKILDPNQSDAKALCYILDDICAKREFNEDLISLWKYLRPKVSKKTNYNDLKNDEELRLKVDSFLNHLLDNNVMILKKGELEDYYTDLGEKLTKGIQAKELKVLRLLEIVGQYKDNSQEKYNISDLLDISDYEKAILQVTSTGSSVKSKIGELVI